MSNIKLYLENSYKYIKDIEEAYQHNFGYIEGYNEAGGLSKDEYYDFGHYNQDLRSKKEEENKNEQ